MAAIEHPRAVSKLMQLPGSHPALKCIRVQAFFYRLQSLVHLIVFMFLLQLNLLVLPTTLLTFPLLFKQFVRQVQGGYCYGLVCTAARV